MASMHPTVGDLLAVPISDEEFAAFEQGLGEQSSRD